MYGTIDPSYFLHDNELLTLIDRIKCSASEEADRREINQYE